MTLKSIAIATLLATTASEATAATFLPWHSAAAPMVIGQNGWTASSLITVGETLPNGYAPVGIPDGIGAYQLDKNTVRVIVNHELSSGGASYTVNNGGVALKGARISYFDVDKATRGIVNGGIAYSNIYDRAGNRVTNPAQVAGGFNRFCSSSAYEANSFGGGKGLSDRMYFTGEENGNGTMYALDTATGNLHAVPAFGKASFENAALVDTGNANTVAFLLADDSGGAPQTLYVGTKNTASGASFLDRNGLVSGKLYAWKSNSGDTNADTFNGPNGTMRGGSWVEVTVKDASKAGTAGYDAAGYANAATIAAEGRSKGAFAYSRLEDVATNPADGSLVAFAVTGTTGTVPGNTNVWGGVYTIKIGFDAVGNPTSGKTTIVYNGNLDTANRALRSPDNLDWANDTELLVQEDKSADWFGNLGANPNESGVLKVGLDGVVTSVARVDRSAIFPVGAVDVFGNPAGIGEWETSGILDVSKLFGYANRGTLFLGDVQAHGIKSTGFDSANLVEGGQLFFLRSAVPEPASWAMMIAGFGLVGVAKRRRNRTVVVA